VLLFDGLLQRASDGDGYVWQVDSSWLDAPDAA
jgi:hypothetical protein